MELFSDRPALAAAALTRLVAAETDAAGRPAGRLQAYLSDLMARNGRGIVGGSPSNLPGSTSPHWTGWPRRPGGPLPAISTRLSLPQPWGRASDGTAPGDANYM